MGARDARGARDASVWSARDAKKYFFLHAFNIELSAREFHWLIDSGATCRIVYDSSLLHGIHHRRGSVTINGVGGNITTGDDEVLIE